jgi:hypothetical protein
MTVAEAARRNKVCEQSISRWELQFLEAGRNGPAGGGRRFHHRCLRDLCGNRRLMKHSINNGRTSISVTPEEQVDGVHLDAGHL